MSPSEREEVGANARVEVEFLVFFLYVTSRPPSSLVLHKPIMWKKGRGSCGDFYAVWFQIEVSALIRPLCLTVISVSVTSLAPPGTQQSDD